MQTQVSHPAVRLLTVAEVAAAIGITAKTIRNQITNGTFPIRSARASGRRVVRSDDLAQYIERVIPGECPTPVEPVPAVVAAPAVKRGRGRPRKLQAQSSQ
ncbi:MAG: helix-turn-helix domain-containing protein [Sulfuritalea sp.]|nr:helix-turn-helix domain-containing protein [Sulfuritalea sp.]MBK8119798.1 helix-turn-helix domain-containing protein [Sulfuritalea sp.]MBK9351770.1 helix-turn-helix domain-containing protein [Sulfuritalea sp.]